MTRDDVIAMACATGFGRIFPADHGLPKTWVGTDLDRLLSFAAMVASAEREACAKACDTQQRINLDWGDEQRADTAKTCAAAIRARPTGHKEST
ncbi:hypothetical protein [Delftia deserti]|uniref:Uncharacterized protein n=1 Tax=Delftia deserti TaxID=1651218 RepID=A0ABW5EVU0_9BURK